VLRRIGMRLSAVEAAQTRSGGCTCIAAPDTTHRWRYFSAGPANRIVRGSESAATKTAKTTAVNNTGPTILGRTITAAGVPIFTTTLNGADSFDGEGSSTQGNTLAGSLTVTVMEVQPNGNLVIQGDKTLRLNQGDEFVHVSGVVRRADIATDNTVTSDKVADAHISYSGKGVIDSANRMGWLARFFNSAFAPY
jgi:flagellar L-ring protein precursor FlgH